MRISEHALTRPCVAEKSIDSGADPSRVLMGRTREIAKFRQLTQGASGTAGAHCCCAGKHELGRPPGAPEM
jgi:hypothetical protein